jgi:hypothetical protein
MQKTTPIEFLKELGYTRRDSYLRRPDDTVAAVLGTEPGTRTTWYAVLSPSEMVRYIQEHGKGLPLCNHKTTA